LANREHVEILASGAREWNAWRRANPHVRPDLRRERLAEADLRGYDLRNADFRGGSLLAADLSSADLRGADLSGCDLRFCIWSRARLSAARLRDARGADERMLAAAARDDWRTRLPLARALQAGVAAAALAAAWALVESDFSDSFRELEPPPSIELAAALSEADLTAWPVEGVAISGGLLRVRLVTNEMTEAAYLTTLQAACKALDERSLRVEVSRIEVLQRDAAAGWAFEEADRCPEVLRAPRSRLAFTVAAASRPLRVRHQDP
jgi:hypothetical protein